jgi:translation elongation factor EF-Tu-like GTPase
MVLPGDSTSMTVELSKPIALNEGLCYAATRRDPSSTMRPDY